MVEGNDAYKHGRYEKNWFKSLHEMYMLKVFAMQDGWPADQTDEHDSLHRHECVEFTRLSTGLLSANPAWVEWTWAFTEGQCTGMWQHHMAATLLCYFTADELSDRSSSGTCSTIKQTCFHANCYVATTKLCAHDMEHKSSFQYMYVQQDCLKVVLHMA